MTSPLHSTSHVIACAVGKGGTGKTSVVANVGGTLASAGYRVLLVSLDSQDNLGEDLGYAHDGRSDDGEALARGLAGQPLVVPLREVRPNLDVVSGGPAADAAIHEAAGGMSPRALHDALLGVAHEYDFILIDCPPGPGFGTQSLALAAARWLLVTTKPDAASRKGIRLLVPAFQTAREHNPDLQLIGVVLFAIPARAERLHRELREFLEAELAGLAPVLRTRIRDALKAATAARDRGVLAAELAGIKRPRFWEIRAGKARDDGIPENAEALAEDYQDLTADLLTLIATKEPQS